MCFFFSHGISQAFLEDEGQFLFDALIIFVTCPQISRRMEAPKKLQTCQTKKNRMNLWLFFVGPLVKNYPVRHTKDNEKLEIQRCSNRNALVFVGDLLFASHWWNVLHQRIRMMNWSNNLKITGAYINILIIWATKKTSYFPLYWLVYRDPYIGLLKSPYNCVV